MVKTPVFTGGSGLVLLQSLPGGLTGLRFNETKGPGPNFFPAERCLLSKTLLTFPWDWHSRLLYVPVLWEGD